MRASRAEWDSHIHQFHDQRPGITDQVLRRCRDRAQTPYEWLIDGPGPYARVLDVACGNGPLRPLLGDPWIGVDASLAELHAMPNTPTGSAVVGDVRHLPVPAGASDAVVCSMALMLVDSLDAALHEIARVLRPGGSVCILIPARNPLTLPDTIRYLELGAALRTTSLFPPSPPYRHAEPSLARAGLSITSDRTRRFSYLIDSLHDARLFVESLYLPRVRASRTESATRAMARWVGTDLGISLRRVTAVKRA